MQVHIRQRPAVHRREQARDGRQQQPLGHSLHLRYWLCFPRREKVGCTYHLSSSDHQADVDEHPMPPTRNSPGYSNTARCPCADQSLQQEEDAHGSDLRPAPSSWRALVNERSKPPVVASTISQKKEELRLNLLKKKLSLMNGDHVVAI